MSAALQAVSAALENQTSAFEKLQAELESLRRHLLPKRKTESMRPPKAELEKRDPKPEDPEATRKKRSARKTKQRQEVANEVVEHPDEEDKRTCPCCGNEDLKAVGDGQPTRIPERVLARLLREPGAPDRGVGL